MAKIRLTAQEINEKVIAFHNQMLFLRLVNSGRSFADARRNEFVNRAFDLAYNILQDAYDKKDISLFNRIYSETPELVKGPYITPEMEAIQARFYEKTSGFVQGIAMCLAENNNLR